ncbi:MAG: DUF4348 domain-containing protein [Bacteroidota bacterium]|jgi:hypothetical protein
MRLLFILLTISLVGCGTKTTELTTDKNVQGENFDDFFNKFRSDSIFQMERVKFPLTLVTWDIDDNLATEEIDRENWRHLKLEYKDEFGTREIDAYTQETKIYADSAKIELRGVDNGIHVDYVFNKVDGQWTLTTERDYSN